LFEKVSLKHFLRVETEKYTVGKDPCWVRDFGSADVAGSKTKPSVVTGKQTYHRFNEPASNPRGHRVIELEDLVVRVARVAGEDLVSSISSE
jgi:hypothetical protein